MSLFNKLKTSIWKTWSKKVKSHKSLKAVMEAVDFHVFRYRKKTGKTYTWKRGGIHEQRQYTDSMSINLPDGYKIFAFNIDQFLHKCNNTDEKTLSGEWAFTLNKIPKEVIQDLHMYQDPKLKRTANKAGYAAWIEKDGEIYPLRKTKYEGIKLEGTTSKKMIYRRYRDGSLEESFIKVLGAYIISTVVNKKGDSLMDIDIDPKDYQPKKENTDWKESKNRTLPDVPNNLELGEVVPKIENLHFHKKEDIWKVTNGSWKRTTLQGINYVQLAKLLGEPTIHSNENFAGDKNKTYVQWDFKIGANGISIYDYKEESYADVISWKVETFHVGSNAEESELLYFLKKKKLEPFVKPNT